MRSYGQYCPLARALDVVGERWTLLIIRELFAGDCRYSDLRDSLPGIASNLLAERLRRLQDAGVVEAEQVPRPVRATVYRLTSRGRDLAPAIRGLIAWGTPLVAEPCGDDAFRTHWLPLSLPRLFEGAFVADLAPLTVHLDIGDEPATLQVTDAGLTMTTGVVPADDPLVVTGPVDAVVTLLTQPEVVGPEGAGPADVEIDGSREAREKLRVLAARSRLAARADHRRPSLDGSLEGGAV